jgi:hypothetical protein
VEISEALEIGGRGRRMGKNGEVEGRRIVEYLS